MESELSPSPLSKTAKYKKITKPLLERKRRARINRCLDDLKELMVGALEIDDENLSKLEKADILELTVNHLTKLHRLKNPALEAEKFKEGFERCTNEACKFITSAPEINLKVRRQLVDHLIRLVPDQPLSIQVSERPSISPPISPTSIVSDRQQYYSDLERSSSDAEDSAYYDSNPYYCRPDTPQACIAEPKSIDTSKSQFHGLPSKYDVSLQEPLRNRSTYSAKASSECKDVILQKIRRHIMDKREHENAATEKLHNQNSALLDSRSQSLYCEPFYQNMLANSYQNDDDTLDLRICRSPETFTAKIFPSRAELCHNKPLPPTPEENKVSNVPNQHVLSMDCSELPPKKKRKLIEFQEHRKQEARRRYEASMKEEKRRRREELTQSNLEALQRQWRPW